MFKEQEGRIAVQAPAGTVLRLPGFGESFPAAAGYVTPTQARVALSFSLFAPLLLFHTSRRVQLKRLTEQISENMFHPLQWSILPSHIHTVTQSSRPHRHSQHCVLRSSPGPARSRSSVAHSHLNGAHHRRVSNPGKYHLIPASHPHACSRSLFLPFL